MDLKMSADKNYPHLIEPPVKNGWFYVRLFSFKKIDPFDQDSPDHFNEWVFINSRQWDLGDYANFCRVEKLVPHQDNGKL